MNLRVNIYLLIGMLLVMVACESDDEAPPPTLSSAKAITEFTVESVAGTIDEGAKTITAVLPNGTDLTALAPVIVISDKATVSPASGSTQDFSNPVIYKVTAEDGSSVDYTATVTMESCVVAENIYSFTYDGKSYEVVLENKTWIEAAACAAERGGYLAEINNVEENTAIFEEVMNNAGISNENTVANDGGGASYVWLGGNDLATEGAWVWDGNNDGTSVQFWEGDFTGAPVDGLYNNWGNEPDNFGDGQDGLGLALTEWPLGSGALGIAGQWNDVNEENTLYYVIEYD